MFQLEQAGPGHQHHLGRGHQEARDTRQVQWGNGDNMYHASPLLAPGAGEDAPLRVGQWRPGQRPAADLAAGAQHRLAAGAARRHGHRPPQGD